jgi:5-methylthioadenosine/S-adenosylhomocysteine deaminase
MTLTITGATLHSQTVGIRIVGDTIERVGPDVVAEPGEDVIDAAGMAVMPGLVNAHTHAAMTLFRGYGDDLPLMEWLRTRIWPAEAHLTHDDVYWGTRLAIVEMLRSGTTTFWDMYWHGEAVAQACVDAGIRGVVSAVLIDQHDPSLAPQLRESAEQSLDALGGYGPLVRPALGPHAVYTVSDPSLEWIGGISADRGVPVHIHCSETEGEVAECVEASGVRPAVLLDRLGVLSERTLLAHGCWLDPHELALVAERGATVATNPVSNQKLAVGRHFPYPEAATAGVAVGLGTDGAASNNSLDLLQDAKAFALAQKFAAHDPTVAPAAEVLEIATGQRSALLGGQPIEAGAPADLVLLRTDSVELAIGDVEANTVYAATGADVDTVIVAGRVLVSGRQVADADDVVARASEHAERVRRDG